MKIAAGAMRTEEENSQTTLAIPGVASARCREEASTFSEDKDYGDSNSAPGVALVVHSDQIVPPVEEVLNEEALSNTETHQIAYGQEGPPIVFGLVPLLPALGQPVNTEAAETQPGNSNVPAIPLLSYPPDQCSIAAASQHAPHLFRQQYPPNFFPYGPYYSPYYMPPPYIHQFLSPNGIPQPSYFPSGAALTAPSHAKPGNTENPPTTNTSPHAVPMVATHIPSVTASNSIHSEEKASSLTESAAAWIGQGLGNLAASSTAYQTLPPAPHTTTAMAEPVGAMRTDLCDFGSLLRKLIYVLLDFENFSLSSKCDVKKVIKILIKHLKSEGIEGVIAIEAIVGTFDKDALNNQRIIDTIRFNLMAKGIAVFQAYTSEKNGADAAIVKRIKNFFNGCKSGVVVVISSDCFYVPICHKISMNVDLKFILLYDARKIGTNTNLVNYQSSGLCFDFALMLQRNKAFNGVRPGNIGEPTAKSLFLQARKASFPVCPEISSQLVWAPFDQNSFETNWGFGPITIDTDWPKFIGNKLSEEDRKCFVEGMQSMLEGYMHLSDLDEAVIKNIEACKDLSTNTRTSFGPKGMKKMVINPADTNDAAIIVNALEIQHPAAKLLVLAAKAQQEEIRDGAKLIISFAGELLHNAKDLISMGLHPSEITSGYTKAINKAVEILEELAETMDVRNKDEVISRMRAAVASKQFGQEKIICSLVADACIQVCPNDPTNFNVDNVRVAKRLGGDLQNSCIKPGMVLESDVVGRIKRMEKAKVAVFADGVDTTATETTGTEQRNYAEAVEELIKAGAKVIVSGGSIGEKALHFCDNHGIMVLKISSEIELSRFCQMANLKLSRPSPDDLGYVDSISVEEIGGGVTVSIARNEEGGNSISTVVLRGSTDSILDDLERAVDDGVHTYKAMCRDSRIVPGAAATEMELAQRLKDYANEEIGLDKYAISKYAESFGFVPKTLAENAGLNARDINDALYTGHRSGKTKLGIDLEQGVCKDVSETKVWDLFATKLSALKYASDAACTVLRVDQIIDAPAAAGAGAEED